MRALIVDDEAPARALLAELLGEIEGVEVVGEAANGFEAVRLAGELAPDLLLLDIQMPKLDGFEVLELVGDGPAVVFVTAHDEHAVRAFAVHAVDYLVKPIDPERLRAAIDRCRERLGRGEGNRERAREMAAAARPAGTYLARVVLREEGQIRILPIERIDFVEARDDYLHFHAGEEVHRRQQTLAALAAELDPRRFIRIHRSYLLQIDRLVGLDLYAKDSWVARLASGRKLPVSRAGYDRLRQVL